MKIKLFLLLGVFALITGCQNDDDGADNAKPRKDIALSRAEEVLADGNLDFAFRLFQQVNATETKQANWIISPLSASLALGMTANGAAGNTLEEIKNTLGFGTFELAAMNSYNQKLIKEMTQINAMMPAAAPKNAMTIALVSVTRMLFSQNGGKIRSRRMERMKKSPEALVSVSKENRSAYS